MPTPKIALALVALLASLLLAAAAPAQQLTPQDLRCEQRVDPLGIDEVHPRLSWTLSSDRRAASQTAYRILVASTPDHLARAEGDLWDSGKVASSDTVGIVYAGKPLPSRRACFWKVRAWNQTGEPGDWSEPAQWELGLLSPGDWQAQWISAEPTRLPVTIESATYTTTDGATNKDVTEAVRKLVAEGKPIAATNAALGGDPAFGKRKGLTIDYRVQGVAMHAQVAEGQVATLNNTFTPYLRKSFSVTRPVKSARLYATALGLYEAFLNGQPAGDARLAPGWTDYRRRVSYQTIDVTSQIRPGSNVLGAVVAPGWFAGRCGLFHARAFYGQTPALLAQLELTFDDGTTERIVSDSSWMRHDGPMLTSDIMDGEVYDARAAIDNWCTPGAGNDGWTPVTTREETRTLQAAPDAPVRALVELPARDVKQIGQGRWVFDLGQNMVGVARIRVNEPAGTIITLRHAEMLNPSGTLYVANLRGAAATDTYICRGGGEETWEPRFTFHGFRYVEISGVTRAPGVGAVTGIVLGSDLPATGTFECSDQRLNQLFSNIVWGLRGNYVSIPTDCPQRDERMGWMGDAQAFIPTAASIADVGPFMTKWMRDVRDAQREDGAHPDVAPVMNGLSYGTPAWADAGVIVPWEVYRAYGDRRVLEENIDSMKRWVDWCKGHSNGLIREKDRGNDYGDWLSIEADTPKDLIGTAYFARSADLLARSYGELGRAEEAAKYRELFGQIRGAFAARYIAEDGRIAGNTQTSYLLALAFGLVPEELRSQATGHLVADLRSRGWRLSTGFIGVGLLLPTLDDSGHTDAAYRLLMQDEFPSWLFSVKHGATTIWERWNGWTPEKGMNDPGMNSFNHYALGSCGQWLIAGVGGIRGESPGYSRISIQPRIGGGLTWARTQVRSVHGVIATGWELQGEALTLMVEVPANTTATIRVPTADPDSLREGGLRIDGVEGVRVIERGADSVVLEAGSGSYNFTVGGVRPVGHPQ